MRSRLYDHHEAGRVLGLTPRAVTRLARQHVLRFGEDHEGRIGFTADSVEHEARRRAKEPTWRTALRAVPYSAWIVRHAVDVTLEHALRVATVLATPLRPPPPFEPGDRVEFHGRPWRRWLDVGQEYRVRELQPYGFRWEATVELSPDEVASLPAHWFTAPETSRRTAG